MKTSFRQNIAALAVGAGAGFFNGLLGAGGGILLVFGLKRLFAHRADVTSHAVHASALAVMLPLSLFSVVQYISHGHLDQDRIGLLVLPAICGGALGAFLLHRISSLWLSRIFAFVVLLSGVLMIV